MANVVVPPERFRESNLSAVPIRTLGLTIKGTQLEPILQQFDRELDRVGVHKLRPRYYLSTEWGVPSDTIAMAIPFYLARPDLINLHARRTGYVEGLNREDILRYLRHEMGHVVNYAYRLYEDQEWIKLFGSMTQPYIEDYRPEPFSPRFVHHLPGWYAQKHPDEDWAETFAVWMTPGRDWRADYAGHPEALAKLEYCERTMQRLRDQPPVVTATELDEDVSELPYSLEQYYGKLAAAPGEFPPGLDGALRVVFEEGDGFEDEQKSARSRPASALIRRLEPDLLANTFRWTGHFPERTRTLLRHLEARADQLHQIYAEEREIPVSVALTTLVTALALNYVRHGTYLP
jgi:Putative zinc-binding metallo-peptidase